ERLTPDKLEPIRAQDAVLLGAIGHPDAPRGMIERDVVIGLRRGLDLYVNLRPVVLYDDRLSPLRGKGAREIHMTVIRENTEDVYAAEGTRSAVGTSGETASVEMRFTRPGVERILRYAFELAQRGAKHVTLVDKANAIPVQEIWRDLFDELGAKFADVRRDAMGARALLREHLGESSAASAVDGAIRDGLRTGRIKGVEAGVQPTDQVAETIARALAG